MKQNFYYCFFRILYLYGGNNLETKEFRFQSLASPSSLSFSICWHFSEACLYLIVKDVYRRKFQRVSYQFLYLIILQGILFVVLCNKVNLLHFRESYISNAGYATEETSKNENLTLYHKYIYVFISRTLIPLRYLFIVVVFSH